MTDLSSVLVDKFHSRFHDLMPGFGYGARWTVARRNASSATSVNSV